MVELFSPVSVVEHERGARCKCGYSLKIKVGSIQNVVERD